MKKKITSEETLTASSPELLEREYNPIIKLENDFGRDDLNLMRDKINEIIENGNK